MASQQPLQHVRLRNNVVVLGEGEKTIVLTHGPGCDQRIWHKIVPLLIANYRLVLVDYVGAGESDLQQYCEYKYASLQGHAEDLLEVVGCLELSKPYLLAHSGSASISVLAEHMSPAAFERLILLNASPCFLNDGKYRGGMDRHEIQQQLALLENDYHDWADQMVRLAIGNEHRPELAERLLRNFQHAKPEIMLRFIKAIWEGDFRTEYFTCTTPVTLINSRQDRIVPPSLCEYLQQKMPHCEHIPLQAEGHYPQLSHAREVVSAIRCAVNKARHAQSGA